MSTCLWLWESWACKSLSLNIFEEMISFCLILAKREQNLSYSLNSISALRTVALVSELFADVTETDSSWRCFCVRLLAGGLTVATLPRCPWLTHPVRLEAIKCVLSQYKYSPVISSYFPGRHPRSPKGKSRQAVWNHEASLWSKTIVYIACHWCFFGRSGILWQSLACYPYDLP